MGNFYANVVVRGMSPDQVRDVLVEHRIRALVTPSLQGCVVVYEQRSDEGDLDALTKTARALSSAPGAVVLAAMNHDDDVLILRMFRGGVVAADYVNPRAVFYGVPVPPGSYLPFKTAWELCRGFERRAHVGAAWFALQRPYLFQVSRHADLADALGLPPDAVVLGHRYVTRGELPGSLTADDMLRT